MACPTAKIKPASAFPLLTPCQPLTSKDSPPTPFGKPQGVLLADLPGSALNWFARDGLRGARSDGCLR